MQDALDRGATRVVGGEIPDGRGYFYAPTVLDDVPEDARVFHEEIFGPVAPVGTFESEEDAIARANDTEYGLVAYVFTRDIKRALRVCEGLETGHGRPQPGHGLERRRAVRRRQAVGHRPRGRQGGARGVPRDEVRGGESLARAPAAWGRRGRLAGVPTSPAGERGGPAGGGRFLALAQSVGVNGWLSGVAARWLAYGRALCRQRLRGFSNRTPNGWVRLCADANRERCHRAGRPLPI